MGNGYGATTSLMLACFLLLGISMGEVYKVGDSQGWTIIGNINYTAWASSKEFQVGDIILFEYNSKYHNVMEVHKTEYHTCNASAPIVIYTTGNDSIAIKRRGHHYFICGVPGHCDAGQKVDIRIPKLASAAATSPASAPPLASPVGSPATPSTPSPFGSPATASTPSPQGNAATARRGLGLVAALIVAVAVFCFCM